MFAHNGQQLANSKKAYTQTGSAGGSMYLAPLRILGSSYQGQYYLFIFLNNSVKN